MEDISSATNIDFLNEIGYPQRWFQFDADEEHIKIIKVLLSSVKHNTIEFAELKVVNCNSDDKNDFNDLQLNLKYEHSHILHVEDIISPKNKECWNHIWIQ